MCVAPPLIRIGRSTLSMVPITPLANLSSTTAVSGCWLSWARASAAL